MKTLQYFSDDYLDRCRAMGPEQIVRFLEDFRTLHARPQGSRSRLISLKVPEGLLQAFKTRARLSGVPYQTQIKRLMEAWLSRGTATVSE